MDKDHFFVYNGKRSQFLTDIDCNCAHNVVICGQNEVAVSAEGGTVEIIDWRSSASVCSLKGHNGNVSEQALRVLSYFFAFVVFFVFVFVFLVLALVLSSPCFVCCILP